MPDRRHAEILQVLGREPRQDLAIDGVVPECLLVLSEPEPMQPSRDVHATDDHRHYCPQELC